MGRCLLGLLALYAVYAVGAFVAIGPDVSLAYRLLAVASFATFPLPTLAALATFIAALDCFDVHGESGTQVRRRDCKLLAIVALSAYAVSAVGPAIFDVAVEAAIGSQGAQPREGRVADDHARIAGPFAVGLLVLVGALVGATVGPMTTGFAQGRRRLVRWAAGAVFTAAFWGTLVGVSELITMYGILSPFWLAVLPPTMPLLLTGALAPHASLQTLRALGDRRSGMDPIDVDKLVTAIVEGDGPDRVDLKGARSPETAADIAALVAGARRLVGTRAAMSEARATAIVANLSMTSASTIRSAEPETPRRAWGWAMTTGACAASWACLSCGFLVIGGAPIAAPVIVSAILAGCCGTLATVFVVPLGTGPRYAATTR